MQKKILGIINVDFDAEMQLLIIYSAFFTSEKMGKQCIGYFRLQDSL
jgi:hypothetical protein